MRRIRLGEAGLLLGLVLMLGCTSGSSLVGVPTPAQSPPSGATGPSSLPVTDVGLAEHVPQQMIIRFLPGASTQTVVSAIHGTVVKQLKTFNTEVVDLPQGASVVESIKTVQAMSGVKYAEPNYVYRAFQFIGTPNDPGYPKQWGPQKINAPAAWMTTTGSSTSVIAIIDTGVFATHEDFSGITGKVLTGINALTATTCTTPSGVTNDDNGHGTHVAGIAAAIGNNMKGIAGISWASPILPIKVLDGTGMGTAATVACGLDFAGSFAAANPTDRVVANLSLGGSVYSQLDKDAVDTAIADNVVVIAAAGNDGKATAMFPADYPGVMAVGATDPSNHRAPFSSYGPRLSVVAPGVDIYSTLPMSGPLSSPSGYGFESGTSMAAPHVAGVAALVRAVSPSFSVSQVRSKIEQTATSLAPGGTGFDPQYGSGLVNAGAAIGPIVTNNYGGVQVTVTRPTATPANVTLTASAEGGSLATGTYYVEVGALDVTSRESLPSPEASVSVTGPTGSITVSWTAVPAAISYRVYFATTSGGEISYFTAFPSPLTITSTAGLISGIPPTPADVIIWNATSTCTGLTQAIQTARTNSAGVALFNAVPAPSGNSYCATASETRPASSAATTSPFTVTAGATTPVPLLISP